MINVKMQIAGSSESPAAVVERMAKRAGIKVETTDTEEGCTWISEPTEAARIAKLHGSAFHLFREGTGGTVRVHLPETKRPEERILLAWRAVSVLFTANAILEKASGIAPVKLESIHNGRNAGGEGADSAVMDRVLRESGNVDTDGALLFPIAGTDEGIAVAAAVGMAVAYACTTGRVIQRTNMAENEAEAWKNAGNRWGLTGPEWAGIRAAVRAHLDGRANGTKPAAERRKMEAANGTPEALAFVRTEA